MAVAAIVIALVSAFIFGVLLRGLVGERTASTRARATSDALEQAARLETTALTMQSDVRGYLLSRAPALRGGYRQARAQLPVAAAQLARVEDDPAQRRLIAQALDALAGYTRLLNEAIATHEQTAAAVSEGARRFAVFRARLDRYVVAETAEQTNRRARSAQLRDRSIRIASIGLAVLLVLIVAIAIGAVRAIVTPVRRLQRFARELGGGSFAARLPEAGPPETRELARVFNLSAESLGRMSERHLAELDAVFRTAPLGLAFLDPELRVLRVNDALARMYGVAAERLIGRGAEEVALEVEVVRGVAASGEPVLDAEHAAGGRVYLASYFPVRADGPPGEARPLLAVGVAVSDITASRRAQLARERLQAATAALAAAATVEDVAVALREETEAAFPDARAGVWVGERGGDALVRVAGAGERDRHPLGADADAAVVRAVRERTLVAVDAAPSGGASWSAVAVPMVASGRVLGSLSLRFPRLVALDDDERALLHALASQSAIALARAQAYEREHFVAQTLQASLLPRALPRIPGLELAARLQTGAPGVEVGGDFYDAFAIGDGRWGIAIGDVCGKGVEAAALTALARHTIRAAAADHASPVAVLEALNRAVLAEGRTGQFLTAIYGTLRERPAGGFELALACGGHPPPVLLDAARRPRPLACAGTLLGVIEAPLLSETRVALAPGDTLALYTDGLTEAGAPAHTLTTEEVARLLGEVSDGGAAAAADGCLRRALAAGGGVLRDDVAVLVARVTAPRSAAGRSTGGESST